MWWFLKYFIQVMYRLTIGSEDAMKVHWLIHSATKAVYIWKGRVWNLHRCLIFKSVVCVKVERL